MQSSRRLTTLILPYLENWSFCQHWSDMSLLRKNTPGKKTTQGNKSFLSEPQDRNAEWWLFRAPWWPDSESLPLSWIPNIILNYLRITHYRMDRHLSRFCWARKRVNDFKLKRGLKEGQFRLDICKKSFKVTVVRHWHRRPREVADTPYLKTLNRFGVGLTNLIKLKMSLILAGGLD